MANIGATGVPYYTPAQTPPAGTAEEPSSAPTLFQPIKTRGLTLHNRFVVAPMCTYSAKDGFLTDWHLVHLGQFALAGAALTMVEATAVEARGRISPQDLGIWSDAHIAPLCRVTDYIHSQGVKAAIQIAHAGRKASSVAPWLGGTVNKTLADASVGGWPDEVVGPSAIAFSDAYATPKELTVAEIKGIVQAFADGAKRAIAAGFDVLEIHGAHGYLNAQFLSPVSNKRTDEYGGSFENRTRFLRETIAAMRAVMPEDMPLWLRISGSEWLDHEGAPSWELESTIRLARLLPSWGIDVLDVSSGGNRPTQRLPAHTHAQVDLAGQIREAIRADGLNLAIAAVGRITEAELARSIVQEGGGGKPASDGTIEVEADSGQKTKADFVLAARQFLRDPQWVLNVARELNVSVKWPNQYHRAKLA